MVYILGKIEKEKCFREYSRKNNAFLDYENKQEKSQKNCFFPKKLVFGFGQNFESLPTFYFRQNGPRKLV